MEIKLLPSQAKETAQKILDGILPPETGDFEVLYWLAELDSSLSFYRFDRGRRVDIDADEIKIAFELDIELRPQSNPC